MPQSSKKIKNKPKQHILVFVKDGVISLWIKQYIWHKWIPKTPKLYADAMAKMLKRKPDYGPCFWGMHAESPKDKGYAYIGTLDDNAESFI